MRIKRTKKDYGGGIGRGFFESDLFQVVLWSHHSGSLRTVIRCKLFHWDTNEISFDGNHDEFKSDKLCMEQFTGYEILKIIKRQKKISFEAGRLSKAKELRDCLEI